MKYQCSGLGSLRFQKNPTEMVLDLLLVHEDTTSTSEIHFEDDDEIGDMKFVSNNFGMAPPNLPCMFSNVEDITIE